MHRIVLIALVPLVVVAGPPAEALHHLGPRSAPKVFVRGSTPPSPAQLSDIHRGLPSHRNVKAWYRAVDIEARGTVVTDLVYFTDGGALSVFYVRNVDENEYHEVVASRATPEGGHIRVTTRGLGGYERTETVDGGDCRLDCASGWGVAAGSAAGFCAAVVPWGPFGWIACATYAAGSAYLAQRNCEACAGVSSAPNVTITPANQVSHGGYGSCSPTNCAYYTVCYSNAAPNQTIAFSYGSNAPIQGPTAALANGFCSPASYFYQGWNPPGQTLTYTQAATVCSPSGSSVCGTGYATTTVTP